MDTLNLSFEQRAKAQKEVRLVPTRLSFVAMLALLALRPLRRYTNIRYLSTSKQETPEEVTPKEKPVLIRGDTEFVVRRRKQREILRDSRRVFQMEVDQLKLERERKEEARKAEIEIIKAETRARKK